MVLPSHPWLLAGLAAAMVSAAVGLDNGLGRAPPMGWSSWNYFATHINESVIMEMADAMVSTGLAKAGYQYINVDAGYLTHHRTAEGKLVVNNATFPSGMRALADHIHARGLRLGVYTDLTAHSCGPGPGSFDHYEIDARTFAHEWTADYLKVDYCGSDVPTAPEPQYTGFAALRDALNATGRAIYYSICPHARTPGTGTGAPYKGEVYSPPMAWTAAERKALANSLLVEYTNTFDLWYADPIPAGDGGVMREPGGLLTNIDSVMQMTKLEYSVPGSWGDADMLQICTFGEGATRHYNSTGKPGNLHGSGMTMVEYKAHLSIWSVLASPLIQSADLRTVGQRHPECLKLMLNPEIIAVNQDAAGQAPSLLYANTNVTGKPYTAVPSTGIVAQAWSRPLSGGRHAVVLFNRGEVPRRMSVAWASLGLAHGTKVAVRDVVERADLADCTGPNMTATVAPHAALFVVLTPQR